jgi:hypothetical protein
MRNQNCHTGTHGTFLRRGCNSKIAHSRYYVFSKIFFAAVSCLANSVCTAVSCLANSVRTAVYCLANSVCTAVSCLANSVYTVSCVANSIYTVSCLANSVSLHTNSSQLVKFLSSFQNICLTRNLVSFSSEHARIILCWGILDWTTKESWFDSWQGGKRFFLRHGIPPTPLSSGLRGLLRRGCEADHSPPSRFKVKNSWNYTSTYEAVLNFFFFF